MVGYSSGKKDLFTVISNLIILGFIVIILLLAPVEEEVVVVEEEMIMNAHVTWKFPNCSILD